MIGLIVPANIKYSPYVRQYIDCCREKNIKFEIIVWNKSGIDEGADHIYECPVNTGKKGIVNSCYRIITWPMFARFAKKICKEHRYDKLVIFTAQLGLFLSTFLEHCYRGKYIYDIRDYSPFIKILPWRFQTAVKNAAEIVVSSPDFNSWIRREKVYLSHNADVEAIETYLGHSSFWPSDVNTLISMGDFIEYSLNKKLLEALGNDNRFEMLYIGRETPEKYKLAIHAKSKGYSNVRFEGTYDKKEVYKIYNRNRGLVNIIREKNPYNAFALPNKLYEGIIVGLPIVTLGCNITLSNIVRKYSLGIVIDNINEENFADDMNNKILQMDFEAYCKGRKKFLGRVLEEQGDFKSMTAKFLLS